MTLDSIALWLGYGVMLVGGFTLVAGLLFFVGLTMAIIANKSLGALVRVYDMKTLRATMRQLEAEGKVSKKVGGAAVTIKISVNCQAKLSEAIANLAAMFRDKKYVVVSLRPGKDRTLDQNALWFGMYKRIAEMTQIGDIEDARRYCKLHFGVQILLNEDEDFRAAWYRTMRHLSYEEKLDLMGGNPLFGPDGFPVTRLFNRAQGVAYTDRIAAHFTELGVVFTDLLSKEAA